MARGGKRLGSGRKPAGDKVAVLVRLEKSLADRIARERNGKSMSATVEWLLRSALTTPRSDDDAANRALGFVVSQAAHATGSESKTWQNDLRTMQALQLALPLIVDYLACAKAKKNDTPHPVFKTPEEHARFVFMWTVKRLSERGDEYGTDWPADHPARNFPKAAAALNLEGHDK